MNILKMWPMPNFQGTTTGRNYEIIRPEESILGYQAAVPLDYQPWQALPVSVKYQGAIRRQQVFNGTLPGWNDSKMVHPRIGTLKGTYGRAGNELDQRQATAIRPRSRPMTSPT